LAPITAAGISSLTIHHRGYPSVRDLGLPDLQPLTALTHLSWNTRLQGSPLPATKWQTQWQLMGQLATLQHLQLGFEFPWCDRGSVPCQHAAQPLGQLEGLTRLALKVIDGAVSGLDELLPTLRRLQHLELECSMQQVPQALTALSPTLTCLVLTSAAIDPHFPPQWEPVGRLQRLRSLTLSNWELSEVPQPLAALSTLTHLQLCSNHIRGGWQHLQPVAGQLQRLDLVSTMQAAQPDSFAQLLSAMGSLTHVQLSEHFGGDRDMLQLLPLLPRLFSLHLHTGC